MFRSRRMGNAILFYVMAACCLCCLLACSKRTPIEDGFALHVEKQADVARIQETDTRYQVIGDASIPYIPEYKIGPGDVIEIVYHIRYDHTPDTYRLDVQDRVSITFPYHPQFSTSALIRTDGRITVPIIGDVPAVGKTPEELAAVLNRKFAHYMLNPTITVAVEEFNVKIEEMKKVITTAPRGQSKIAPVTPDGRISFPIIGTLQAGGLTLGQLERIVNERYTAFIDNINATLILLEVHHPKFYIGGEVRRPGAYDIRSRINLLDALFIAGAAKNSAYLEQVVVYRYDGLEKPMAFTVDLKRVLDHGITDPNLWVRQSDIIYVPKARIDKFNDLMEKVFTKGVYTFMPFTTTFSWGEKDLGGDGGDTDNR